MSKRTESSRSVSGSPNEPCGRAGGKISSEKFRRDSSRGAQINRNTPGSSLSDATDEDLVRAFLGECTPQAHRYFMALYRRYADRVYQKCLAYTNDEADARDLTQEVFIKLYTGLSSFRFQSSVSTWIYRISINHCLNFLRTKRHFTSFDEVEAGAVQIGQHEMDVKLDLSASLRKLPEATRSLLLLKYVESYTYEEIAELTGLNVSAVKMRISRARQSLIRERTG